MSTDTDTITDVNSHLEEITARIERLIPHAGYADDHQMGRLVEVVLELCAASRPDRREA